MSQRCAVPSPSVRDRSFSTGRDAQIRGPVQIQAEVLIAIITAYIMCVNIMGVNPVHDVCALCVVRECEWFASHMENNHR